MRRGRCTISVCSTASGSGRTSSDACAQIALRRVIRVTGLQRDRPGNERTLLARCARAMGRSAFKEACRIGCRRASVTLVGARAAYSILEHVACDERLARATLMFTGFLTRHGGDDLISASGAVRRSSSTSGLHAVRRQARAVQFFSTSCSPRSSSRTLDHSGGGAD